MNGPGLLSLPNELLERIAYGLRRAGNLRLVSRHLDQVVAPVVWASLHLPDDADTQSAIISGLIKERDGLAKSVKSVRYDVPKIAAPGRLDLALTVLTPLPRLSRLHVFGVADNAGEDDGFRLPVELWDSLPAMLALRTLVLDRRDLKDVPPPPPTASPLKPLDHPDHLVIRGCLSAEKLVPFRSTSPSTPSLRRNLRWTSATWDIGSPPGASLLVACLGSTETVIFDMSLSFRTEDLLPFLDKPAPWESNGHPPPTIKSLTLTELYDLFSSGDAVVTRILAVVARGPLEELALDFPFDTNNFSVSDALASLVMPKVTTLRLSYQKDFCRNLQSDLYTNGAHIALTPFLRDTFPALTTLHMKGWFDTTDVRILASTPSWRRWTELPTFVALLTFLRRTQVVELRLTNSEGHRQGENEGCFWRDDAGSEDWRSWMVKYL